MAVDIAMLPFFETYPALVLPAKAYTHAATS